MRTPVTVTLLLGCIATLLVLSVVCAVSSWYRDDRLATAEKLVRFRTELDKLDNVAFQLAQAESAQRTYLLTGDGQFLRAYHEAQVVIQRNFTDIRALMTGTLLQQQQLSMLEFQAQELFAAWQWTLELWKNNGPKVAAQDVLAEKSSKVTANVQRLIHELGTEEQTILQRQLEIADTSAVTTTRIVDIVSVVSVYLLTWAGILFRDYLLRRKYSQVAYGDTARRANIATGKNYTVLMDVQEK